MSNVISGFAVVILIIALGYFIGRRQLLGSGAVYPLNMFVFWIALPAMLITFIKDANLGLIFGPGLAIAALSGLGTGLVGLVGAKLLARRGNAESLIMMLCCSYNNSSHLGIPLVVHILSDATATLPIILFQVGLYAPLSTLALDFATRSTTRTNAATATHTGSAGSASGNATPATTTRFSHLGTQLGLVFSTVIRNPLILAAATGVLLSYLHSEHNVELPFLIAEPLDTLARSTVAVALVAFGISLASTRVLQKGVSPRKSVWVASGIKTILHPLLAIALGHYVFGADQHTLLVWAVVAGLPTGQNVFTYAQRYQVGTVLARDTAVVSTLLSVPTLCTIFYILG